MTTYAVTGASGQLGRLAVEALLAAGVPARDVVAVARSTGKAAGLADVGVAVREGDYDRPETLASALEGVARLLLVSGDAVGQRVRQHAAVIEAAKAAGVVRIAYTSILRADTTRNPLAPEHKVTEEVLRASGVPFVLLRTGWYLENYTSRIPEYVESGEIVGAAGAGRVAAAPRADYAAAAAAALTGDGHDGAVYELGGPAFTFPELAEAVGDVTGTAVRYRDVAPDLFRAGLIAAGLDEGAAGFVTALEESAARGELDVDPADLERLLGRPATPLRDGLRPAPA